MSTFITVKPVNKAEFALNTQHVMAIWSVESDTHEYDHQNRRNTKVDTIKVTVKLTNGEELEWHMLPEKYEYFKASRAW